MLEQGAGSIVSISSIVGTDGNIGPLKELLYAKRVLDNYMAVAKESSPLELLTEMTLPLAQQFPGAKG